MEDIVLKSIQSGRELSEYSDEEFVLISLSRFSDVPSSLPVNRDLKYMRHFDSRSTPRDAVTQHRPPPACTDPRTHPDTHQQAIFDQKKEVCFTEDADAKVNRRNGNTDTQSHRYTWHMNGARRRR